MMSSNRSPHCSCFLFFVVFIFTIAYLSALVSSLPKAGGYVFNVPGQWGGGKRGRGGGSYSFSLPGSWGGGKRALGSWATELGMEDDWEREGCPKNVDETRLKEIYAKLMIDVERIKDCIATSMDTPASAGMNEKEIVQVENGQRREVEGGQKITATISASRDPGSPQQLL